MNRRRLMKSGEGGIDPITGRGFVDGYEVVDLGLSSGLLFATCNVGATKETDYGDYYMYGKGSQKYTYGDSQYNGNEIPLSSSADTATQVMGERWWTPTEIELREITNTNSEANYEWVTNFNESGISGGKFTSKINPNAYVFFPAVGYYNRTGKLSGEGSRGYVWSSTLTDGLQAYSLSSSATNRDVSNFTRTFGIPVRGVCRKVGEPMPPLRVLFVNKNDTTQKEIFEKDDWPSASDWTPIGIVVVPSSHGRYGNKNGIMSLGCLNDGGTMQNTGTTDNLEIPWGEYGEDTSTYKDSTCDGSKYTCYVQHQTNSSSTTLSYHYNNSDNIAYPYTDLTAVENRFLSNGSLKDYDGVGNTNKLYNLASTHFPAAVACKNFKTIGTSAGDWYLPSVGELAYLPSIRYQVNDTISALNTKYGNVGFQLDMDNFYWSSSEVDENWAWFVDMSQGYVDKTDKDTSHHVRAFMRF